MLLGCIKKKKTKRASALILALIISVSSIMGAVFTVPVSVFALSAGGIHTTIASIILSLLLQTGAAPVNQTWVNSLNSAYGYTIETAISDGLLTESAGTLIDTGLASSIEASAEYTSLGLSDIFTTTASDVGVMSATGGVNIANTAINVGTAGTIGAFAGAAAIGVGAGVLINHVRERLMPLIKYGFPMSQEMRDTIVNNIPEGYSKCYYSVREYNGKSVYSDFYFAPSDSICVAVNTQGAVNGAFTSVIKNKDNRSPVVRFISYTNKTLTGEQEVSGPAPNMGNSPANQLLGKKVDFEVNSSTERDRIINQWIAGQIEPPKTVSPDIIGPVGNQYYDDQNDTIPGLTNQIPEGSDMTPVNMDDYQHYIDSANNNTNNGDTGQTIQGEGFDDLIDSLIVAAPTIPDEPIIPDQPVDVPVVPDRPVTPDQPTMPNKPGLTDQEIQEALNGVTTIDLRSIFPFCIPFDLYNILLIFDTGENRKAPHITFNFPFTDWTIDVDLAVFNPVAGILRLLELILFIIGLAVATRKLIGAGGG